MSLTSSGREPLAPVRVTYIGGWGRSGSTLLARMLGELLPVCSVGELRDVWLRGPLEDRRCGCGEPFSGCDFWRTVGVQAFGGWHNVDAASLAVMRVALDRPWHLPMLTAGVSYARYRGRLAAYTSALTHLYRALQQVSGARVILDSSKIATYGLLLSRTPGVDVTVVHLVRDSRGVIHSWQRAQARGDGPTEELMLRYGPLVGALRYDLYNSLARTMALSRIPYLRVRYEDLMQQPVDVLQRIAQHAGVAEPTSWESLRRGVIWLGTQHTLDGNPMRFRKGPIQLRHDERWRTHMSRRDRRTVTLLTGPWLRAYGYWPA